MSSTNKTSALNLNQWLETDKPTRSDFVSDNLIIDGVVSGHIEDMTMHLTSNEKTRVSSPYFFKMVQGTDELSRNITFDFSPQMVIYFACDSSPTEVSSGTVTVNWGIAVKNYGSSNGCGFSGSSFIVKQTTVNGVQYNLNNSDFQYVVVAFR